MFEARPCRGFTSQGVRCRNKTRNSSGCGRRCGRLAVTVLEENAYGL